MMAHLALAPNWQQKAHELMVEGQYAEAATLYEQAIAAEPKQKSYYWHLGLLLVLQGAEEEAQTTWLLAMADGEPEEIEQWTIELLLILDEEAGRQHEAKNYLLAWTIRQHIREIDPSNVTNLLLLVQLSMKAEQFVAEDLTEWNLISLLKAEPQPTADLVLLAQVVGDVLMQDALDPNVIEFAETCIPYFIKSPKNLIDVLIDRANRLAYQERVIPAAIQALELGLQLDANHLTILRYLSLFHQNINQHEKGIALAQRAYEIADDLLDKIAVSSTLLRGLMATGGRWKDAEGVFQEQLNLLSQLIEQKPTDISRDINLWVFNAPFFQPYLRDDLKANRLIQNQVAEVAQANVEIYGAELVNKFRQRSHSLRQSKPAQRTLKIGYISSCLRQHSVGWLARWLYQHHDRENFQIYTYLVNHRSKGDWLQDWYIDKSDVAHKLDANGPAIANRIYDDEIDILVDLDSLTVDTVCEITAFKPAPVQVTWLGWDASGIPAIDYYIVDPYVLPENAEQYYSETLWRMPSTYIAVDGFELGIPSLRRDHLNIPDDAVVYLSAQRGHKRHPHTVRLQLRILKEVSNSYFLIKSLENDESLRQSFIQMAEEEGVSGDRLRFLPGVPSESIHRANLSIADVVLDTYPYNGATTTLETLWVGVPLVTRVGEHFSSRNSYTMMMNAGITEGIAWTDDEYIEWGIRLGKDVALRQQITWKLWKSRQTDPLWDAKQFTRDIEKAYRQMWERYLSS
jgi:predicted O-linked N-acetylglucosamine transferase (SPINDLY family)